VCKDEIGRKQTIDMNVPSYPPCLCLGNAPLLKAAGPSEMRKVSLFWVDHLAQGGPPLVWLRDQEIKASVPLCFCPLVG
jgi:hypothetical protein